MFYFFRLRLAECFGIISFFEYFHSSIPGVVLISMATEKKKGNLQYHIWPLYTGKGTVALCKGGVSKVRFDVIQCVEKGSYVQPCILYVFCL